jgi:hypothetical protein
MTKIKIKYHTLIERWGKVPIAITLTLILLVSVVAIAIAAQYVIDDSANTTQVINGAIFKHFVPTDASGTGVFDPFIRISANMEEVQGYNTDYRPLQFQEDKAWTESLKLSEVPMVLYEGVVYREFQLDINQINNDPKFFLSLDEVQIWLGGSDAAEITGFMPGATPTDFGTFSGFILEAVYNLDADEDNHVKLNYTYGAGSGKRNMKMLVPDANFGEYDEECIYLGEGCEQYVVFYTMFGTNFPNNDGFEEWGMEVYSIFKGYKYYDYNANGMWDEGEPGLEGWEICAVQDGYDPICVLTREDGSYVLPVPAGTYTISEICPVNEEWFQSEPAPTDGVCGSGVYNRTIGSKKTIDGLNFGNYQYIPPVVEKTAVGTYDRTVTWDLNKYVNVMGTKLAEYTGEAGDSWTPDWLIFVTKDVVLDNYKVTGDITIENLNVFELAFMVTDMLNDGTVADVTCPTYTIPANDSVVCTYEALPTGGTATLNTATVSVEGEEDVIATAAVMFTENLIGVDEGTLTDSRFHAFEEIVTATSDFTLPETFTCSTDPSKYTNGTYTETFENWAYLNDIIDLEDDASVKITCTLPPLEVEKTAEGSFDRTVTWDLEKYVNEVDQKLDEYVGLPGDAFPTDWLIFVEKDEVIDNYKVTGDITIDNPAAIPQAFTITDVLDDGTVAVVDCPSLTVPAGGQVVCTYEASPTDGSATLNTATVTAVGNPAQVATAPVLFVENLIGYDQGTLTDDRFDGIINPLFSQIVTDNFSVTLSETFYCPPTRSELYEDGIFTDTVVNTAFLNDNIELEDFATITIYCEDYGHKSGYKWNDLDADGIWDKMVEPVLPDWKIHFYAKDMATMVWEADFEEVTTNALGFYEFNLVLPGVDYAVCEVLQAGFVQTFPHTLGAGFVDCTQFGPDYGPVGYLINLDPGEFHEDNDFGNFKPLGCTYTQGYWKTHSMYGPAGPYDPTWAQREGENAVFFDEGNPKFPSATATVPFTWYSMFWTPPAGGNAYIILAHQYMAAWLNVNNVDPLKAANIALLTPTYGDVLADAEYLLKTFDPYTPLTMEQRAEFIELAGILDMFNNGELGVPHCDTVD